MPPPQRLSSYMQTVQSVLLLPPMTRRRREQIWPSFTPLVHVHRQRDASVVQRAHIEQTANKSTELIESMLLQLFYCFPIIFMTSSSSFLHSSFWFIFFLIICRSDLCFFSPWLQDFSALLHDIRSWWCDEDASATTEIIVNNVTYRILLSCTEALITDDNCQ